MERDLDWEEWAAMDQAEWWEHYRQEEEARRQLEQSQMEDTEAEHFFV